MFDFARPWLLALALTSTAPSSSPLPASVPAHEAGWGKIGIDIDGMDPNVRPGDDFWSYVNGRWARSVKIPADRGSVSQVSRLNDLAATQVSAILRELVARREGLAGDDLRIADYYASLIDQRAIDRRGAAPLIAELRPVRGARSHAALAAAMGTLAANWQDTAWLGRMPRYFPSFVHVGIDQDPKNPKRYVAYLDQSGLGMPNRDYYLRHDAPAVRLQRAYRHHLAAMLRLLGAGPAEASRRAAAVYRFERDLAVAQWPLADLRDADKAYNIRAPEALRAEASSFDWHSYLEQLGLAHRDAILVLQPGAVRQMAKRFAATPLPTLKDWLSIRVAKDRALVLPRAFAREEFRFSLQVVGGATASPSRWSQAVELTATAMPDAVSKRYVDRHFPPDTKRAIDALVRNIIAAMDGRLARLSWMSPGTKVEARKKLAAFKASVGYPDRWKAYDGLAVLRGDAYGNFVRAGRFEYRRNLARIDQPVDRDEWFMMPIVANAYSNAENNQIVFSAAYLQAPHFDPHADAAVNYGAIGSVIGHEISHQFDDQGSKFDANGRLANWWTAQDRARFEERARKLAKQFSSYEALPGLNIRGDQTLGENIADLTGMAIAYDAYRLSLGGRPAPIIDGLTGDQRFFIGRTQVYRALSREGELRKQVLSDMHAPSKWRAWTVRNLDSWYRAFGVKPGDRLYLDPKDRMKIWE